MFRGIPSLILLLLLTGQLRAQAPAAIPDSTAADPTDFAFDPATHTLLEAAFGATTVGVAYGRPGTDGGQLGHAIPYGERWITGAAGPTYFFTSRAILVNGRKLPAGDYVLFTIPDTASWTVVFNANPATTARNYLRQFDVLTLTAPAAPAARFYDRLTFSTHGRSERGLDLHLSFENVRVLLSLGEVDQATTYAARFAGKDPGPDNASLLGLARFIYRSGGDPAEALEYIDRSLDWEENCYNLHLKGLILVRLGRTVEAANFLTRAHDRAEAESAPEVAKAAAAALRSLEKE